MVNRAYLTARSLDSLETSHPVEDQVQFIMFFFKHFVIYQEEEPTQKSKFFAPKN